MNNQITEHRDIMLPNGQTLSIDLTEEYLAKVREHYKIPRFMRVSDSHIASFFVGAVKGAVEKAENQDES